MVAVDAGPMQIQSCAAGIKPCQRLCCRARRDATVRGNWLRRKSIGRRLWSKKVEEGIGLRASTATAERFEGRRAFELERVVSAAATLTLVVDWKLISTAVSRSTTFIGLPHLGQRQRPSASFSGDNVLSSLVALGLSPESESRERESRSAFVGSDASAEVTDAHEAFGKDVQ